MKKFLIIITTLVVLSLLLAACAPQLEPTAAPEPTQAVKPTRMEPAATPQPTQTVEPTPVEPSLTPEPTAVPISENAVKIVIMTGWDLDIKTRAMTAKLQEQFNQSHPDIQIEFLNSEIPIIDLRSRLAKDAAPDIVMPIDTIMTATFYDEWLDLTPYIQRDNFDLTRFFDKAVEAHTFGEKGMINLPLCFGPAVLVYDADLFDAAGVAYPPHQWEAPYADGEPWTYAKLVEIAKKLTLDANGKDANSPDFNASEIKQWGWGYWYQEEIPLGFSVKLGAESGKPVSNDNRTSLLLTQPYIDAFTFIRDTIWTWHIRPTVEEAQKINSAYIPMDSNVIAMDEIYFWKTLDWDAWSKNHRRDWAALPAWPPLKPIALTNRESFVLTKSGKHPDQAWEVIKWLYEPAQLEQWVKSFDCLSPDKETAARWLADKTAKYPDVDFQVVMDSINYIEGFPNHEDWKPEYTKVNEAIYWMHQDMLSDAELDPLTALTETDKKVQKLLDEYWASHE